MKRILLRAAALAACLAMLGTDVLAQEGMRVYVSGDAMNEAEAAQAIQMLAIRWPEAAWTRTEEGTDLRSLVLEDRAPQLAICSPAEARSWAREGLLLPLQTRIGGQRGIQRQVLDACVADEQLFMAPLQAQHRQIAVNVEMFERAHLERLLSSLDYPAWYPAQMQQIVEEISLLDMTALEIWPPEEGESAALEALVQAIFGGCLVSEDGTRWQLGSEEIQAGVSWLNDLLECGLIAMAESREAALARFVRGETAMFIDWSEDEALLQRAALTRGGIEIAAVSYPSATGLPVRSYELTGVCVFDSGDAACNALALRAAERLYEGAQTLLGGRAIFCDDCIWLPCLSAHEQGATAGSLFAGALKSVLAGEAPVQEALVRAQDALDAMQ